MSVRRFPCTQAFAGLGKLLVAVSLAMANLTHVHISREVETLGEGGGFWTGLGWTGMGYGRNR